MRLALIAVVIAFAGGTLRAQESSTQPATQPAAEPLQTLPVEPALEHQGAQDALGAQDASSQPAPPPDDTAQKLERLVAVIEAADTLPGIRRGIAMKVVCEGWPGAAERLAALLSGASAEARVAVATVLSEVPQHFHSGYADPLLRMLEDGAESVRNAAAAALGAANDPRVRATLREWCLAEDRPQAQRLAAVSVMRIMAGREACAVLVETLDTQNADVARAALREFEAAVALEFGGDADAARAWWKAQAALSAEAWNEGQIARLSRANTAAQQRLRGLETRLSRLVETTFQRAADPERTATIEACLADEDAAIRLLGQRLVQLHLAEGRPLAPETQARIRATLASEHPRERAAAVQSVAGLREPADADRLVQMLAEERERPVVLALLNALGHLGGASAAEPVMNALTDPDPQVAVEVVTALGRLAERRVLADGLHDRVVDKLLRVYEQSDAGHVKLRERTLWAMGNVADPRFAPAAAAGVGAREAAAVRSAAVRVIAALRLPSLVEALLPATRDEDAGVRRLAVETLAAIGTASRVEHLDALLERVVRGTDESIRQIALRGLVQMLARGSGRDLQQWEERLATHPPEQCARLLEVWSQLGARLAETERPDRFLTGMVKVLQGRCLVHTGRTDEARDLLVAGLDDLHAGRAPGVDRYTLELLRLSLEAGFYDASVASAISDGNPAPDPKAVWDTIHAVLRVRIQARDGVAATRILDRVEQYPPVQWSEEALQGLRVWRAEVSQIPAPSPPPAPDDAAGDVPA